MQKKKNVKVIDLSNKSPEEILEYLQAILAMRYSFHKNGMNVRIKKTSATKKNIA